MKIQYPILIEKGDDKTAWGIIVPDIPGCFSAADNDADILTNAREAILFHLASLGEIPKPSRLSDINTDGFTVELVEINFSA